MYANHTPIRPAAVRLRVGCPSGRMRVEAGESLSDCRLTSVRGRPCAIGYVGRPSVAGWRMAWRAWASHPVGWHVGKKKAGHHRWHPALSYRKAYRRLFISCSAFLFVTLLRWHSRRNSFVPSSFRGYFLLAGGSFTLRTSLLIPS